MTALVSVDLTTGVQTILSDANSTTLGPDVSAGFSLALDPALRDIKVIVCSSLVTKEETGDDGVCRSDGRTMMAKPVRVDQLNGNLAFPRSAESRRILDNPPWTEQIVNRAYERNGWKRLQILGQR